MSTQSTVILCPRGQNDMLSAAILSFEYIRLVSDYASKLTVLCFQILNLLHYLI